MKIIICGLLLLFCACNSGEEIYYIGNDVANTSKIVLTGLVDADSGCIVNISRTVPAISQGQNIIDTLKIEGARIILYENGDSIAELQKVNNSVKYQYAEKNFTPKVGARYKIRASAPHFSSCESEEETLIAKPILTDTAIVFNSNPANYVPIGIFNFKIMNALNATNFYEIEPYAIINFLDRGTSAQGITTYNMSYLESNTVQDVAKSCSKSYFSDLSIITSNACYQINQTLSYSVKTNSISLGGKNTNNFNFVTLLVSSVPESYLKYYKATETNSSAQYTYNVPNTLYTNIKGGFGIFYTKNTIRLTRQK